MDSSLPELRGWFVLLLLGLSALALGASPLECGHSFGVKRPDAAEAVPGFDLTDFTSLQGCAGFEEFQLNIHPILLANCYNCHRAGGQASLAYALVSDPDGTDLNAQAANYAAALFRIQGKNGSQDPGLTLFVQKMSGQRSHQGGTVISPNNPDYDPIVTWVSNEIATPCGAF